MNRFSQTLANKFQSLSLTRRRLLIVAGAILTLLLLVLATSKPKLRDPGNKARPAASLVGAPGAPEATALPPLPDDHLIDYDANAAKQMMSKALPAPPYTPRVFDLPAGPSATGEPRVSYSAELAVITKEFARARSSMEEILERHRGYTARLRMAAQPGGSELSATLRVPASEYASALADLKAIGEVERDEESADEIVQQHGDLEARLQNAQNAELRLQKFVETDANRAAAISQLQQQQLVQLRGEIERLRAERQAYNTRAVFSNIHFSLREERLAPVESFTAQLRTSALSGLADVLHILSTILLFFVNYGPSLLLWAAILFFPVRMLWRRSRPTLQQTAA